MPTRKTRQQKITASQRKPQPSAETPIHANLPAGRQGVPTSKYANESLAATSNLQPATSSAYAYVSHDLKHIAWITVACLILLAIATLFLSDFATIASLRNSLHLPTL